MTHWTDDLVRINACKDAIEWAREQPSLAVAWKKSKRGDHMLWLVGKANPSEPWSDARKPIVACCAEIASTALPYCNDDTITATLGCIDATERWCRGEAERDEVESAAAYAANTADARADAAAYAAYAAYGAIYADATYAYAAAVAAADAAAARAKSLEQSADIVRKRFPNPPKIGDAK
jgi:hypothetical protein